MYWMIYQELKKALWIYISNTEMAQSTIDFSNRTMQILFLYSFQFHNSCCFRQRQYPKHSFDYGFFFT